VEDSEDAGRHLPDHADESTLVVVWVPEKAQLASSNDTCGIGIGLPGLL